MFQNATSPQVGWKTATESDFNRHNLHSILHTPIKEMFCSADWTKKSGHRNKAMWKRIKLHIILNSEFYWVTTVLLPTAVSSIVTSSRCAVQAWASYSVRTATVDWIHKLYLWTPIEIDDCPFYAISSVQTPRPLFLVSQIDNCPFYAISSV